MRKSAPSARHDDAVATGAKQGAGLPPPAQVQLQDPATLAGVEAVPVVQSPEAGAVADGVPCAPPHAPVGAAGGHEGFGLPHESVEFPAMQLQGVTVRVTALDVTVGVPGQPPVPVTV